MADVVQANSRPIRPGGGTTAEFINFSFMYISDYYESTCYNVLDHFLFDMWQRSYVETC